MSCTPSSQIVFRLTFPWRLVDRAEDPLSEKTSLFRSSTYPLLVAPYFLAIIMASNSTCEAVLSCGDSALSITGSLIGILTFAYALIITVLYRTRALGNADQDIQYFGRQIEREIRSFRSSIKWLQSLHEADDKPLEGWDAASSLIQEAERIFQESEKLFRPTMDGNYPKWRLLLEKGRFLSRKTEIQKYLGDILQIRSNLEAKSQELASR